MTDDARKTGPAVEAHIQFLTWLVPPANSRPANPHDLVAKVKDFPGVWVRCTSSELARLGRAGPIGHRVRSLG